MLYRYPLDMLISTRTYLDHCYSVSSFRCLCPSAPFHYGKAFLLVASFAVSFPTGDAEPWYRVQHIEVSRLSVTG